MRRYIDEYYETEDRQWLSPSPEEIKEEVLRRNKNGESVEDIVEYLQEWMYIFNDDDETKWEKEVVKNIIEGKPVINRWTNFKFY